MCSETHGSRREEPLSKRGEGVVVPGYLSEQLNMSGPFLVVVPLSTVPNWIKEFRKWLPQCNAVVYVGDSRSREVSHFHPSPDCAWCGDPRQAHSFLY